MKAFALFSAAAIALLLSSCVTTESYDQLTRRVSNEKELNDTMRGEVGRLQTELAEADAKNIKLNEALAAASTASAVVDTSALDDELRKLRDELAGSLGGDMDFLEAKNAIGIRFDDGKDVLFASGSWTLNKSAQGNLDKVAQAVADKLKAHPAWLVRVDGHTDSDPIKSLHSKGIESNTELSFMRAAAVREYLTGKGVPTERCMVLACGEFRPIGKEKKLNRRVEVWVSTPEGFSMGGRKGESPSVSK